MTSGVFPPDVVAAARASQAKWGIFASVTLAQWALESSWGARMSGKNNPFGIKATAGQAGTTLATHEQNAAGVAHVEQARFADYGSMAEAFDAHGKFLSTKRYAPVRAAKNAEDAAHQLQACGYATDVEYPSKLITIMRAHGLYAYDGAFSAPVIAAAPAVPTPGPIVSTHVGVPAPAAKQGFWARFFAALTGRKAA